MYRCYSYPCSAGFEVGFWINTAYLCEKKLESQVSGTAPVCLLPFISSIVEELPSTLMCQFSPQLLFGHKRETLFLWHA